MCCDYHECLECQECLFDVIIDQIKNACNETIKINRFLNCIDNESNLNDIESKIFNLQEKINNINEKIQIKKIKYTRSKTFCDD